MDELRRIRSQRPVIILLTDGKNEGSFYQNTHLRCAEAGVRLFTVGLTEQADHQVLQQMAEATNGIYFRAPRDSDLPEIYARLAAELGKRYLLHADLLRQERGSLALPIDATVERIVAMADGGARVGMNGPNGSQLVTGSGRLGTVHIGKPEPGQWDFTWTSAAPGTSLLALFGDTHFFLDVFPPQFKGGRLSIGATLAFGPRPLAGGRVWVEPSPGTAGRRIELFDDGLHNDGEAGDGVYGAVVDVPFGGPDRFDITVRAAGTAWDKGNFVRQTAGLVIRTPEEPEPVFFPEPDLSVEPVFIPDPDPELGRADQDNGETRSEPYWEPMPEPVGTRYPTTVSLGGDVDFGVLFPGETGHALARVDLDAVEPMDLDFALTWDRGDPDWPDFHSRVGVIPGSRTFELEITVPETAMPGDYPGRFLVRGDGDLADEGRAKVRVGTVRFSNGEPIDLGNIPPGAFISRRIAVPFQADKEADLRVNAIGDDNFSVIADTRRLPAGQGEIPLEAVASAPIGQPEGEYSATIELAAGPGRISIPLRWRVKSYASPQPLRTPPVAGIPTPPQLPRSAPPALRPVPDDAAFNPDWLPETPTQQPPSGEAESPWEKAQQAMRDLPQTPALDAGGPVRLPDIHDRAERSGGDSFWSAWWVYLLAALLLLLLLLLLIAYILYRLGRSALARLLLASALANFVLLAVFITLLGATAAMATPEQTPTVAVNLVEYEPPVEVELTEAEKELLTADSGSNPASRGDAGGESAAGAAEISFSQSQLAATGELERQNASPGEDSSRLELAAADSASPMPLGVETERALERRQRLPERSNQSEPSSQPSELLEMTEPPLESSAQSQATQPDIGETRLELEGLQEPDRPIWSDGERTVPTLASDEGVLLAEVAGMEAVSMDPVARRVEPIGRRRDREGLAAVMPEPRVPMPDPIREEREESRRDTVEEIDARAGVEELRPEPRSVGSALSGGRPGVAAEIGLGRIRLENRDALPRGVSENSIPLQVASRGGARTMRGVAGARRGAALTGPETALPSSGLTGEPNASTASGSSGASGSPGSASAAGTDRNGGGELGERRFDAGPSGGAAGGSPNSSGSGRGPATAAGTGSAPNPFASATGNGDGDAANPGGGDAPGVAGGGPAASRRGPDGQRDGFAGVPGEPGGNGSLPGDGLPGNGSGDSAVPGDGGPGLAAGRNGGAGDDGNGSGRRGNGGVGEGRFDDMGSGLDSGPGGGRGGLAVAPGGPARIGAGTGDDGLGVVRYGSGDGEWMMRRRDIGRRNLNVTAGSVELDGFMVIIGDFARLPDAAATNLFGALKRLDGSGYALQDRLLAPTDPNLTDTLVATVSADAAAGWSDAEVRRVAAYLSGGGHLWLDAPSFSLADAAMQRLADASSGDYGWLEDGHQLADGMRAKGLYINGKLAAVATAIDWRPAWRHNPEANGATFRFMIRVINYFLSGDADIGIEYQSEAIDSSLLVQGEPENMPETLRGGDEAAGILWDDFGPDSAVSWRMPSWSDAGSISAVSDGQGGRALKLDVGGSGNGRAAVYKTLSPPEDFSQVAEISMDVYYDGPGDAALSMVFTVPSAAGGWADYESHSIQLSRGWNNLVFPTWGAVFRQLSGGAGNFDQRLAGAERMARAGLFLYRNDPAAAVVLIRDIRLHE
ncbi:MAG: VWA domain-containing protein [Planctomycetes bacterium]|nr:VWA domain-containing protein [Planctomycetota bacterium]